VLDISYFDFGINDAQMKYYNEGRLSGWFKRDRFNESAHFHFFVGEDRVIFDFRGEKKENKKFSINISTKYIISDVVWYTKDVGDWQRKLLLMQCTRC
jgi:hypothetical protein